MAHMTKILISGALAAAMAGAALAQAPLQQLQLLGSFLAFQPQPKVGQLVLPVEPEPGERPRGIGPWAALSDLLNLAAPGTCWPEMVSSLTCWPADLQLD